MTLSYSLRLMCLSLATFVTVLAMATAAVRVFAERVLRRAGAMPASRAARFLFAVRMLPMVVGIFCVAALCVPSYLRFEPEAAGEEAGAVALIAAGFGLALIVFAIGRALRAVWQTSSAIRRWEATGVAKMVGDTRVIEVAGAGRLVALVGVARPRLIVSKDAAAVLDREQLDAAIRHEMGHASAFDNWKRLAILLAPGFFLSKIERAWKQFAEWAADDRAGRPLELAEALVRVARLNPGARPPALSTSLLRESEDLAARVERLLSDREPLALRRISPWRIALGAVVVIGLMAIGPVTLEWVHGILERLMD
jgi:beta-lactamase regulating signal transducer with metallopeptidase domain